jgi:hypothetical protein
MSLGYNIFYYSDGVIQQKVNDRLANLEIMYIPTIGVIYWDNKAAAFGITHDMDVLILPENFPAEVGDQVTQEMLDANCRDQFRYWLTHELNAKLTDLQNQINNLQSQIDALKGTPQ